MKTRNINKLTAEKFYEIKNAINKLPNATSKEIGKLMGVSSATVYLCNRFDTPEECEAYKRNKYNRSKEKKQTDTMPDTNVPKLQTEPEENSSPTDNEPDANDLLRQFKDAVTAVMESGIVRLRNGERSLSIGDMLVVPGSGSYSDKTVGETIGWISSAINGIKLALVGKTDYYKALKYGVIGEILLYVQSMYDCMKQNEEKMNMLLDELGVKVKENGRNDTLEKTQ